MADRALFDAYSRDVGRFADAASLRVSQLLERVSGLSDEEAYRVLSRYYPAIAQRYGRDAAARAMAYYQDERDAADPDQAYDATSSGPGDASWYVQDVDEATGRASTGEGHGNVVPSDLSLKVAQRVMERADRTVIDNARRDTAHPRWAFVAHPGACGFCVMCSSWGWDYSEAGAKAQRHAHCRCTYAVDFSGDPSLAGYDPKAMQDAYAMAEETVHDDVDRQWDAMSDEERARYKRAGRSAKDVYKTKRVTAEMDRRDRAWLQDPKTRCALTKEPGARPLGKEQEVARHLVTQGFNVRFIKEINKSHIKTPDAYLNDEAWEFKVPESWNDKTVKNQFKKALGKGTDKLLISCTKNMADDSKVSDGVLSILDSDDFLEIQEVIVMSSDGKHITRLSRLSRH